MNDTPLGPQQIMQRLPHRYPFLLIDRVLRSGASEAVAIKNVTYNEPFFVGHFPGQPVMPGVLIGEAMAQTAAFIGDGQLGASAFLAGINLKFVRPVVPGDQLVITARLIKRFGNLMKVSAEAVVANVVVATGELTVALS